MLPDFLGIGAHKCGTTTLYHLLKSHPHIYLPPRKEVEYFGSTHYYRKGQAWYESFFPDEPGPYKAVGEITPQYLYNERAASLIAEAGTVKKLLVSLRDPAERLYSHYWMTVRDTSFDGSFEDYIQEKEHDVAIGRYATHLRRFLQHFQHDQFLVLIFEEAFADPERLKQTLADFLDVDPTLFPEGVAGKRVNPRALRRFSGAYPFVKKVGYRLRMRYDMDRFVNKTRDFFTERVFTSKEGQEQRLRASMKPETRQLLWDLYAGEVEELAQMFDVDLGAWRTFSESI